MKDFRELKVWEKAHNLALGIYRASDKFPRDEIYGLASQIRRAGLSIPTNIAEGCGRSGIPEFIHFLHIAIGSASEVEYLLLFSKDLNLLENSVHQKLSNDVIEIKRMLASLIKKLNADR
jgi:four helix bundle protein